MKKKSIIAAMICSLALLAFAACSKKGTDEGAFVSLTPTTGPKATATPAAPTPTPKPTAEPTDQPTPEPTKPADASYSARLNSNNVNFRAQPSTSADVLSKLSLNAEVTVLETGLGDDKSWSKVDFAGAQGYVSSQFLTRSTPPPAGSYTARLTTSGVNFRSQPSTDSDVLGKLTQNTEVTVLETGTGSDGSWSKVSIDGKEGYVASKYLTQP